MPASVGPRMRAPVTIDELRAMALTMSSRPTICVMNDWRAGMSKALATPRQQARTSTCPTRTVPVRVSVARTNASTIMVHWVASITRCRRTRSATRPPTGASRNTGIWPQNPTSPSSTVEPVSRYTSHDWATDCIQVPTSDTSCPEKKRR